MEFVVLYRAYDPLSETVEFHWLIAVLVVCSDLSRHATMRLEGVNIALHVGLVRDKCCV